MSFQLILFYALSALLLFAGVRVITSKNPVHAALNLVLAFFVSAGHWLLLQSEFLAIALVLVYVGAVMVLFLFVVMMLDINFDKLREGFWKHLPFALVVAVVLIAEMVYVLGGPNAQLGLEVPAPLAADYSNVRDIGLQLYTTYLYPFELAAVLLLVGIVAAIALTQRQRKETKWVDPATQVVVKRDDRVRLVKMAAVKRDDAEDAPTTDNNA
ncbi:NADH dehydrogenase subunit J [Microvirgula sp. AG722]|uniref:NADH-quinone oxidoreductase subunit J n=1 Tax=Microvirgula sp. AG722 TaxID=2183901 RepID=UPI000DC364EF|nr:NADH-quinone oxidoreductase subunit J [Microvirgula sp. AG722]RAS19785.1 NADH dehydrogenase subunit J [Microvirgula sp. AG722]